ncbi:hypothetical protein C0993_000762 [Termitomyces sp. T159_Od127]|nr:hypothetical protein C0993_000762 [Termitomyces sp. T159_Od127]
MSAQGVFLPFELQEDIIGHLWNDYKTLAACSLVSSQWFERARTLLFSDVTADIYGQPGYLDDDAYGKFMTFMELLEAPQSRLGRYIQRIYIQGQSCYEDPPAAESYSYLTSALRVILPRLTHVSGIKLAIITWKMITDDVKTLLEKFSEVNSLSWLRVDFDHLDQLLLFSDNFSKLQTLAIEELRVKTVSRIDPSVFSQYPNKFALLGTLSLFVEESTVPLLLALSSNVVPVQNLDTLDFEIDSWATLGYVDSILRATGSTLRNLKLQINNVYGPIYIPFLDDPGFDLVPSLRQMVNLKSLYFVRFLYKQDLHWIRNILRTTSCVIHNLEEIHLRFRNDFDFTSLERAILEQKAPNINVIIERIEWEHWEPELLDRLKQSFQELSRRGRVHFIGWD